MSPQDEALAKNVIGLMMAPKDSTSNVVGLDGNVIEMPYTLATAKKEVAAEMEEMYRKGEFSIGPDHPDFDRQVTDYAEMRVMSRKARREHEKYLVTINKKPKKVGEAESFKRLVEFLKTLDPIVGQTACELLQEQVGGCVMSDQEISNVIPFPARPLSRKQRIRLIKAHDLAALKAGVSRVRAVSPMAEKLEDLINQNTDRTVSESTLIRFIELAEEAYDIKQAASKKEYKELQIRLAKNKAKRGQV